MIEAVVTPILTGDVTVFSEIKVVLPSLRGCGPLDNKWRGEEGRVNFCDDKDGGRRRDGNFEQRYQED